MLPWKIPTLNITNFQAIMITLAQLEVAEVHGDNKILDCQNSDGNNQTDIFYCGEIARFWYDLSKNGLGGQGSQYPDRSIDQVAPYIAGIETPQSALVPNSVWIAMCPYCLSGDANNYYFIRGYLPADMLTVPQTQMKAADALAIDEKWMTAGLMWILISGTMAELSQLAWLQVT